MVEAFWAVLDIDRYTFWVVCSFVGFVAWLISVMLGSWTVGVLFSPVLLFCGFAGTMLVKSGIVVPTGDKDTNIAVAAALGVFAALSVLLIGMAISVVLAERKGRRTKGMAHLALPQRSE
jgi:hypothetical protein